MRDVVYFGRDLSSGLIKIGVTEHLERRLVSLRAGARPVVMEAHAPGDRRVEGTLHALFLDDHVGSEWFRSSTRLEAMIVTVREGWLLPHPLPQVTSPIRSASALKMHEVRRAGRAENWAVV